MRGVIAQPIILQPAPKRLGRVEHRRPGRQGLQVQAVGEVLRVLVDRVALVHLAVGRSAEFAWEEFFQAEIANAHTRKNYLHTPSRSFSLGSRAAGRS